MPDGPNFPSSHGPNFRLPRGAIFPLPHGPIFRLLTGPCPHSRRSAPRIGSARRGQRADRGEGMREGCSSERVLPDARETKPPIFAMGNARRVLHSCVPARRLLRVLRHSSRSVRAPLLAALRRSARGRLGAAIGPCHCVRTAVLALRGTAPDRRERGTHRCPPLRSTRSRPPTT